MKMLDIAAAAGVSRSTVSNVMRDLPSVAPEVRARVLREAERLGYLYNRGAATLRMQQSHLIGLVIPDLANPFIAEALRGAEEVLVPRGYLVVSARTSDEVDRQTQILRNLAEHRVDGVMLLPAVKTDAGAIMKALNGLPTVLLNRDVPDGGVEYVGPNEASVGRLGAAHLVGVHQCRTVAYFGGPELASPRTVRREQFIDASRDMGAEVVEEWSEPCEPTANAAYIAAQRLMRGSNLPEGIHCHSDEIAFGVLRALRENSVPISRCRILGTDNVPNSGFASPSLTTISVDSFAIGQVAAERLLRQLGEAPGSHMVVPPARVVERESCGCQVVVLG